jgi:hypothetical protein
MRRKLLSPVNVNVWIAPGGNSCCNVAIARFIEAAERSGIGIAVYQWV